MSDKRYGQWCGLAQALDRVGDRWTLLIIRELLIQPQRYSDLRTGLPGVPSNLLAERLRDLERERIVRRREVPPPTPATVYELTEQGRELEEAVLALIRWGGRFLPSASARDEFQAGWLALALKAVLAPKVARISKMELTFRVPDAKVWVAIGSGQLSTGTGELSAAQLVVTGNPKLLLGLVCGHLTLEAAEEKGLSVVGPSRFRRALKTLVA